VGRFFASVNIAACFLQVFVMPSVLSVSTLPKVLRSIPLVIFAIVIVGYIYPSLLTVMFGFGALKVLEYSIMTSATEMIYMPMSSEQRYLGKELIRFFGHRMGRSAAVMMLSAASAHFKPSMATQVPLERNPLLHVYFLTLFFLSSNSLDSLSFCLSRCGVEL
jgi:ATP/ADP translocase